MIYFTDSFHLISLIMNVTVGLTLGCKKYKYLIITGRSAENVVLMMRLGMTITAGWPDYDELHQHYLLIFLGRSSDQ